MAPLHGKKRNQFGEASGEWSPIRLFKGPTGPIRPAHQPVCISDSTKSSARRRICATDCCTIGVITLSHVVGKSPVRASATTVGRISEKSNHVRNSSYLYRMVGCSTLWHCRLRGRATSVCVGVGRLLRSKRRYVSAIASGCGNLPTGACRLGDLAAMANCFSPEANIAADTSSLGRRQS